MGLMRVIRTGRGEDGAAWADALADGSWLAGARELKADGGVVVRQGRLLDRAVVVKQWSPGRLKRRLQLVMNATPACRQWSGAERLAEIGVRTATPHALVRCGGRELLVMERLRGRTVLEHAAGNVLTVRQQHRLAEAVGWQIGEMRAAGLGNRDHKGSNLLVVETIPNRRRAAPTGRETAVIDTVGVKRGVREGAEPFALLIECLGVGVTPRLALRMRVLRSLADRVGDGDGRALVRRWWRLIEREVVAHGDPTPKVNPLASTD